MAVLILTYNGRDLIDACLRTVLASTYAAFRAIVVDNGSEDGTAEAVRARFPGVEVVRMPSNLGFAAAYNRAIRAIPEGLAVLLNQDTEIANPRWIDELVERAQESPDAAVVTCKLLFRDAPNTVNSLGGMAYWWTGTVDAGFGEADRDGEPADFEPFSGTGGAMLVRRDLFLEAGGFDEAFFMYCEDFDLGWRLRLLGHRTLLAPRARVLHDFSAGLGRLGARKVYLVHRNYLRAMLKNYEPLSLARGLPQFLLFTVMKSVGLGIVGSDPELFWAPWKAVGWNAVVLRDTLARRREVQRGRRVRDRDLLPRMGPRGFEPLASLRRRLAVSSRG